MIWFLAYIATIVAANVAITVVGVVPVGFGLLAPAGVYFAGLAFVFRNQTQEALGKRWSVAAIPIGAALSAAMSADLALASGAAFLLAETADYLVYTPLRQSGRIRAMVASCCAGDVIDSAVFLLLAFHSLDFLAGQVVGKWTVVLPVVGLMAWRRARRAVPEAA